LEVDVMRSSNGVQLFENNSVIQREVVEEVIEEAFGWRGQGSKLWFGLKRPKGIPASLKPCATKSK